MTDQTDLTTHEWHEGGDGHGYVYQYIGPIHYQYIGPIHYLCECGGHFLGRAGWIAHKATAPLIARAESAEAALAALTAGVEALHRTDLSGCHCSLACRRYCALLAESTGAGR